MMKKLTVKLPFYRISKRLTEVKSNDNNNQAGKKTSKERTRKYRLKLKSNKRKLDKLKKTKKQQNKAYKQKLHEKRILDSKFNENFKQKQREWKQNSRKRTKQKKQKNPVDNSELQTSADKTKSRNRVIKSASSSTIRKCAQRARKQLPQSPKAWASTIEHIIKNATPRRKGLLEKNQDDENIANLSDVLNITKVGRPRKEVEKAKRSLAFAEETVLPDSIWKDRKTVNQYRDRKKNQVKRISKPVAVRQQWESRIERFLETNSRVMPNKKDIILINAMESR